MRLSTSILGLAEADVSRWRDLAAAAVEPNPFFEPDFVLPAGAVLRASGVRLLVARDAGGEWTGLIPVRRTGHWRRMPSAVVGSWVHPYCFFGAPLLRAGSEREALAALLRTLRGGTALVALEHLPADGSLADALDGALTELRVRPVIWKSGQRAALRRRTDGRYVERTVSPKHLREFRRQRRLLEAALDGAVSCVDAAGDPRAVDAFLAMEAAGWKGRAGTAMNAVGAGGFFREMCRRFADQGRLELLELRAGDRVAAMKCNLLAGDVAYCFKITRDESLARFSPGVQLELDNVRRFHERTDLRLMDSCAAPDNHMINRLWPDRRPVSTLLMRGAGPAGRVGEFQARTAAGLRQRLKERA